MVYVSMTEVLIKSGGGERDTALNLRASQSPADGRLLEGRAAKASRRNEEKCINLARPASDGALGG